MAHRSCPLPLLALVLVAGCAQRGGPGATEPVAPPRVRVMTYNVNWGGPEMDRTIAAIRESAADVVCIQELTPTWQQQLHGQLGTEYPHMLFRPHLFPAGGLAVLSRWPVRELKYLQPVGGWFPAWILDAQTPTGPIQIAVVHLHPNVGSREGYRHVRKVRRDEVAWLAQRLEPGRPTIVLGDFNEGHADLAVEYLIARGYRNAVHPSGPLRPDWPVDAGRGPAPPDHILFSPELTCFGAEVIDRGGSDHLPVMAVLGLRSPSRSSAPR